MKHVLIVEKQTESLKLNESAQGSSKFLLSGIFTEFDVQNRNRRFYKAENFVPAMNALLEKKNMLGVLYGEFDHPDVFDIAGKNASHAIESLVHNESANRVDGTISLLSTHWGKEARAIINDGYPLFVSSRAAGVTDSNGNVALKELFTYDIVLDPGFASAQVSCVNESLGYGVNIDVPYRIYEMNDNQVNNLFNDNKNDQRTEMDLKTMESLLANEMAKLEYQILTKVSEGKSAPEEIGALSERYELVNEELNAVKLYLEEFKTQMNLVIAENKSLKKTNEKLMEEINENTLYSNHIAEGAKKLNENLVNLESRLGVTERFAEQVASETEITQKMLEHVASKAKSEIEITQRFTEQVAAETKIAQMFAEQVAVNAKSEIEVTQKMLEHVAVETEVAQKFAEATAEELEITQRFVEHNAKELLQDDIFLNYIAEKVDGIIGYTSKVVEAVKSNIPVNESNATNPVILLESVVEYLGINEETEIVNNLEETPEETEEVETPETSMEETEETEEAPVVEEPALASNDNVEEVETPEVTEVPATEVPATEETEESTEDVVIPNAEVETSMETSLLSSLVKILGTDETGVVIEVTPDNKVIIQKSGSEETAELNDGEYEVMNVEENVASTVADVLSEIKKQKTLSNQTPHFFSFLTEEQLNDFNKLDVPTKEEILLTMESSEYFTANDVLSIIGTTLNNKAMSYEDKLISNLPEALKESWNNMDQAHKVSVITESKYFNLVTTADIKNFWSTRPFAKAMNSPEAILIKESANNVTVSDEFSEEYINAFINSMN